MKREIKFRIWHSDIQEMLYQFTLPMAGPGQDLNQAFSWLLKPIMQFTGLKDKNGKEIYEGDIVSHSLDNSTIPLSVVSFEDGMFVFSDKEYTTELIESLDYCEVIGNIYENPELLNQ